MSCSHIIFNRSPHSVHPSFWSRASISERESPAARLTCLICRLQWLYSKYIYIEVLRKALTIRFLVQAGDPMHAIGSVCVSNLLIDRPVHVFYYIFAVFLTQFPCTIFRADFQN